MNTEDRQAWLSTLAHSQPQQLAQYWQQLNLTTEYEVLRQPESGLAQVRGRMGGSGNAFNIGDATMTRAVIRLPSGEMGVGYVLGRDHDHCLRIALLDALLQTQHHDNIQQAVIKPLASARQTNLAQARARTQATKVDFFTLVRGESE
ncbi:phosphonate C-P lyase system protein PhnG [Salinibius halmophilus]|uniref:phosphonate C-P lyase system protein PhnG n=1 Tax=Salinibius halmophilus TaxID=1853216 RepID=UPI000E67350E|nr:phosphonate C-P lyase system protein PhnG [Salinibius halmophilus]